MAMNFRRTSMKSKGLSSMWLVIAVASFLCLWSSDRTLAVPVPLDDPSKPSRETIDAITHKEALDWMVKYKITKGGQGSDAPANMIAVVQGMAGIKVTGQLDFETRKLFVIPRCGNTEQEDEPPIYEARRRRRRKRDSLGDYITRACDILKGQITRVLTYSSHLPEAVQRTIVSTMKAKWAAAIPGTARCRRSTNVDEILIRFVKQNSSDPYPFDGKGGTFGQVFFPNNRKIEMYFDDNEPFTTNTSNGMNLDWVALHELGHTLGLKHSSVRESAMYPWYKGYFPNIELSKNDIQQVHALFGKPSTTIRPLTTTKFPTTTEATTKPTTEATTTEATHTAITNATIQTVTGKPTKPPLVADICKVRKFDSFMMGSDGRTYVFSGDYYWMLSASLNVESGPMKITSKWKELETPINSAYTNRDGKMVFFKGSKCWKYYGDVLEEGPTDIRQIGLPSTLSDLDAAFVWGGNRKTYFFKGNNYWRYNEYKKAVDGNYPKSIIAWGLPHYMDSAMTWDGNKRTYFFRDGEYWRLDDGWLELEKGYPRNITPIWMKC